MVKNISIITTSSKKQIIIPGWLVLLNVLLLAGLLCYSVYRDVQLETHYPGDLRNRQVGARLIEDGKLPYFYKWKQGEGLRYYDPHNADSFRVSNITGTPFFHRLLIPVSDMPFSHFAMLWLVVQYVCFFIVMIICVVLAKTPFNQLLVLNTATVFLYTEAWVMNAGYGQIYMLPAAIFSLIAFLLVRYKSTFPLLLAALLIIALSLIRPIAVVLVLPFMFFFKQNMKLLLFTAMFGFLYVLFILVNPFEKSLWKDYFDGLSQQIKIHQNNNPGLQQNDKIASLHILEGFDIDKANQLSITNYQPNKSENGNIFHLYYLARHSFMPLQILNALWALALIACCWYYYKAAGNSPFNIVTALVFGYTLYMLTEIFSPIHRHQYNTVQWLPVILLAFAFIKGYKNVAVALITLGLLLNITNTHYIPMRHTIGEFLLLAGLMGAVYKRRVFTRGN